jgi:two-component system OmpR family sensor kinase
VTSDAEPRTRPALADRVARAAGGAATWTTDRGSRLGHGTAAVVGRAPLRVRLVAILATLVLAALAISGIASVEVVRNLLVRQVDAQLDRTVATITRFGLSEGEQSPRFPTSYAGLARSDDGKFVMPEGTPLGNDLPRYPTLTSAQARKHGTAAFTVGSVNGSSHWRMTVLPVTIQAADGTQSSGSLAVAIPLTGVDGPVHTLWLIELGVGIVVLGSMVALGFVVVRRSLRPLREVETVAGAIAAGDLSRRVPEGPPTTEVGSLSRSLNGMLAQIEHAFGVRAASEARMRQFVGDASHELRTPLAAVRGYAELYRQGAVSEPEDVASAMRRIEDEAARMGLLVEDLLLLARLDEERPSRTELVDITVLAADAVQDARAIAPDRVITLEGRGGPLAATEIVGDERRLRQVITNLVANAVNHTPAGTPIEVAVGAIGGPGRSGSPVSTGVAFEVRDHGGGVDPAQTGRVFERFFRSDPSRQRGRGGGTGLGLAIVAAIVSAHDGRVGVTETPGGGATFVVELPARALPVEPTTNAQPTV